MQGDEMRVELQLGSLVTWPLIDPGNGRCGAWGRFQASSWRGDPRGSHSQWGLSLRGLGKVGPPVELNQAPERQAAAASFDIITSNPPAYTPRQPAPRPPPFHPFELIWRHSTDNKYT